VPDATLEWANRYHAELTDIRRYIHAHPAILGGISEFERSLILARTEAGIAKARENGKKFGRPSALDVTQKRKIAERYAAGETMAALAADYEVGEATIFRALQGPFEQAA
jgi:DNA invertase Pin-like site-specific DNA recombinase